MLKNKRRSIQVLAIFIFGLLIFSSILTVTGFNQTDSTIEENNELLETEENTKQETITTPFMSLETEEFTASSYDREAIDWRPIEESLSLTHPENEMGEGSISTSTYNVRGGTENVIPYQATPTSETMPELSVVEPYAGLFDAGNAPESVIVQMIELFVPIMKFILGEPFVNYISRLLMALIGLVQG
jgi:hypothetical protein